MQRPLNATRTSRTIETFVIVDGVVVLLLNGLFRFVLKSDYGLPVQTVALRRLRPFLRLYRIVSRL